VHLCSDKQIVHLSIQDNGRGMVAETAPGYGLRNMSDRARLLGGKLNISSPQGKGVALQIDFPWEEET
jgi:two-component system sensor histidine kinase UhpB